MFAIYIFSFTLTLARWSIILTHSSRLFVWKSNVSCFIPTSEHFLMSSIISPVLSIRADWDRNFELVLIPISVKWRVLLREIVISSTLRSCIWHCSVQADASTAKARCSRTFLVAVSALRCCPYSRSLDKLTRYAVKFCLLGLLWCFVFHFSCLWFA